MGELVNYYAAADVTFVGGTIADIGGHNVLEPAALGKPLLIGPSTANVRETTSRLLETGAARRVISANDIENWTDQLFRHPAARDRMGQAGLRLMKEGKGAVKLTLGALERLLRHDPADTDGEQQKPA
jgi:3-deoxy-D-manno-octulosonic-acid transferase